METSATSRALPSGKSWPCGLAATGNERKERFDQKRVKRTKDAVAAARPQRDRPNTRRANLFTKLPQTALSASAAPGHTRVSFSEAVENACRRKCMEGQL